ncbi:MAG: peptide deformylase [Candidatus Dadabacteria bacterium]|nr:MAG: peptide deformylase [Candidatus Dadabacteria bacterium]
MSLLNIRIYPDSILREKSVEVAEFNKELKEFVANMAETMYANEGIGLAAVQVGELKRITVIDVESGEKRGNFQEFINPVIIEKEGSVKSEEGCLSIPGYRDTIKRAEKVKVEAFNCSGEKFTIECDGLLAICLQHEIDHMDGVLFIDHLSPVKRMFFEKWSKKNLLKERI